MPAVPAGPFLGASNTNTPFTPSASAAVSGANEMPSTGRVTFPNFIICSTTPVTVSTGIAKPTPLDAPLGENIAVLIPTTLPLLLRRGPPLLPVCQKQGWTPFASDALVSTRRIHRGIGNFTLRQTTTYLG